MNRAEELLAQVLKKEKEECKACKIILWVLAIIGIILIHCKVHLPTSCVISWFISTASYFGMWIAIIWAVGKALEPF